MKKNTCYITIVGVLCLVACAHTKPDKSSLAGEMAEVLVAHHAYEAAIPLLQRGITQDPNSGRLHLLLGIVLRDRGLFAQARAELDVAARLAPDDHETSTAYGVLLDMQGDHEEADAWHRKALGLSHGHGSVYNNLGFSLYLRHRYTDAISAYLKALERDPGARRVFNNLGFAYARLGRYEDAMRSFRQGGSPAKAFSNMALAYELGGNYDIAESFYEKALEVDKSSKVAKQNLAKLQARRAAHGKTDTAAPFDETQENSATRLQ
jgi:Flp pilus assembly protein TadD